MSFRSAAVSRVIGRGFHTLSNPTVENTTCFLGTYPNRNEPGDLAYKTLAVKSAMKTHIYIHAFITHDVIIIGMKANFSTT